mgnify:CR=1 FL=1
MKNLKKELQEAIDTSLKGVLEEAYVLEPEKFSLQTDALSETTKKLRQEEFENYVSTLNRVSAQLDGADRENANSYSSDFRSLKLDESHNMNASFLRALHFQNISDLNSQLTMDMLTYLRLERDFGTFDDWQRDFIACAMSSRDGYAVTGYSIFLKRYLNCVIDTESLNVTVGLIPVIALDVAEGAYWKDYKGDRKKYVLNMMKQLNWDLIEERIQRAEKAAKVYQNA